MKNRKKSLVWMIIVTFVMSFFQFNEVKANDDINIISTTNITEDKAAAWARSKGATETFVSLAHLYWESAGSHGGVNPGVAYVQAAKETGYGKFRGVINESYHNPCGLKSSKGGDDIDPNAHMKFNNWSDGVQAHLDHLALYAGASGYPRKDTYDPRHFASIKGSAPTALTLGGKWAPSSSYGNELISMYRELERYNVSGDMISNIDEPSINANVYDETLNVKGWALSPSGISKVNVYIDNEFKGNANIGESRPDVQKVYPTYSEAANSGFSMKVDISDLSSGTRTLKIEFIGKDGKTGVNTVKFSIKRLDSIQNVDTPSNGATITGNILEVSGWSLAGRDLKNINFYIDGKLKGSANVDLPREDVGKIYPNYPNSSKCGFKKILDISDISNGDKVLKVEQVKNNGATFFTEVKIKVDKLKAITALDIPTSNQLINGQSMEVKGWALNGSGVKTIKIYIDGELVKTTTTGQERLDVNNLYPSYKDKKSGFREVIDISSVSGGVKSLGIEQIGEDGTSDIYQCPININKLKSISSIESPKTGAVINGRTLKVSGWAISDSGVKEVKAYINGKEVGSGKVGTERKDVKNAYSKYANAINSGFSIDLDISKCKAGKQVIEIEEISNDKSVHKNSVSVEIVKPNPITAIDAPANGLSVKGNSLVVKGWALNYSGVKDIKIYIDSTLFKTTTTGIERLDVYKNYSNFNDKKSGFEATLDIGKLSCGSKKLKVEQIGEDGSTSVSECSIFIDKLEARSVIDTPASGTNINGKEVTISGWAISNSGVKEVQVFVDGKEKGKTEVNLSREDLKAYYPNYPNVTKGGFSIKININDIAPGTKDIKLKEISNDGSEHYNSVKVNIVKKKPLFAVDAPSTGYLEQGDILNVSGWALNPSGVNMIKVYIDGNNVKNTKVTVSRQDVVGAYPGYQTGNVCGYKTSVSLEGLLSGRHIIMVEAIGVDGTISSEAREIFYKDNPSKLIVLDPGHNYGGDDGSYATINGVTYCERDLNMVVAMKTKAALEAKGYRVVLTRKLEDREYLAEKPSLAKRANLANSLKADLFLSIHHNKFTEESANGTEVYYSTRNNDSDFPKSPDLEGKIATSKLLARKVVDNIANVGFSNRGAKDGNLYVLRNVTMPSILVECGFISNTNDVSKLSKSSVQDQIAAAIANGVYNNF